MGLLQRDVAERIGVTPFTILNWEKGRTTPSISAVPGIIEFLRYDPYPKPSSIPEQLVAKRRSMGWSIARAAREIGVDPGTWSNWERGRPILYQPHRAKVMQLSSLPLGKRDDST